MLWILSIYCFKIVSYSKCIKFLTRNPRPASLVVCIQVRLSHFFEYTHIISRGIFTGSKYSQNSTLHLYFFFNFLNSSAIFIPKIKAKVSNKPFLDYLFLNDMIHIKKCLCSILWIAENPSCNYFHYKKRQFNGKNWLSSCLRNNNWNI